MQRSDGSAKVWENMMRDLGRFSAAASPHATALIQQQIAILLPQSMQMSVLNSYALEAQQTAVRAIYQQAHGQAYAVGEYQIDKLGDPKLILLLSPVGLTEQAWSVIEQKVREGGRCWSRDRLMAMLIFIPPIVKTKLACTTPRSRWV
jgi:hypothetical protein